ncbi:cytochrome P450 [Pyrenophora seminiperda CCB06]|uniref:Cytochrome P450 n=1 Tax=Pyrenophora seminiperda CCB06 TaxID=1302712 RepID=A0A3M7MCX7_9PLEO|nr:cytochrome P450 [Pyrenophora seminiperda CCB06]
MTFLLNNAAFPLGGAPLVIYALVCIVAIPPIVWLYNFATKQRPLRGIPVLTLDGKTSQESWYNNPREVLIKGRKLYPDQPFQVLSYSGPKLILPQRYLEEVRDAPEAVFMPYILSDAPWQLPGFDAFRAGHENLSLIPEVLRVKLTQSLGLITESLAEEGIMVTEELFGKLAPGQWHDVTLLPETTKIIGRFTARTMLGEEMAHNPEYVDLTIKHAAVVFPAMMSFRGWPRYLWPLVQRFTSICDGPVFQVQRARQLITKEVERRDKLASAAIAAGQKVPKTHDSVAWVLDQNKTTDKLDLVAFQLSISMAAVHNTSGHLFTSLWYIIAYPKYIKLLREEAISVLKKYGWTRQALAHLTLQDAVHRECLRILRSNLAIGRRRTVYGDLKFSDGFTVPNGRSFVVMPPNDYQGENEEFNPERWVEMREKEGHANKHSFVTANLEHPEFGVGKHACPGRWFANDEIKIAVCILLLRYDWRAPPDMQMPLFAASEDFPTFQSTVQVQITPREPEIDLSNPKI